MDALLQISFSKGNLSTNRTNWRLQHSKIFIFQQLFSILIQSKHLNGQLGPRVSDVTFFGGQLGSASQFVCNIFILTSHLKLYQHLINNIKSELSAGGTKRDII